MEEREAIGPAQLRRREDKASKSDSRVAAKNGDMVFFFFFKFYFLGFQSGISVNIRDVNRAVSQWVL